MLRHLIATSVISLGLALVIGPLGTAATIAAAAKPPIRMLFIGNSYTFANNLPDTLAKLSAAGRKPRIIPVLEAPGGCTFERHLAEGRAARRRALELVPPPELHVADGSHPSPAGTYLAACVFYAVVHGESPVGLTGRFAGLDEAAARRLQEVAWATVTAGKPAEAVR